MKRANVEGWGKLRKQAVSKSIELAQQKTAEKKADCVGIAEEMKLRLLMRLKQIEAKYPYDATEIRTKTGNTTAIFRLRDLTAAYRDIVENVPSEEDNSTLDRLDKMLAEVKRYAADT